MATSTRPNPLLRVGECRRLDFSIQPHIIGVRVSETASEIAIATDSVTANSRSSLPGRPPISSSGRNTATSETLIDRTVKPTSRLP